MGVDQTGGVPLVAYGVPQPNPYEDSSCQETNYPS